VNAENNTAMPPAFLMQQMEWREALEEADSLDDLDQISDQVASARREVLQKCEQLLDAAHDYTGAVAQVRALMFIERFGRDIEARYEQMESRAAGQ
jgi:molecular chaperone HscB